MTSFSCCIGVFIESWSYFSAKVIFALILSNCSLAVNFELISYLSPSIVID